MSTIFDAITFLSSSTGGGRPTMRPLGLTIVVAAVLGAAACSTVTATDTRVPTASDASSTTQVASPVATAATSVPAPTSSSPGPIVSSPGTAPSGPRPSATIDQLVGAPGERVHLRCTGQGAATVLLISGFGTGADGWTEVELAIASRARVCSSERPGTGTSDPATSIETFASQAVRLHTLLSTVGEPGPYVVVGHSFGGAEAVTFASLFADEVSGLVLVDASPTTWPGALCAVPDDGSDAAATLRALCTDAFPPAGNSEHLDVAAAFAEASHIDSLGSLPTAVVTATDRELPAGLAATEVTRLTDVWNEGQQAWMALSTSAHMVSVDHTGHHIEIERPGVVIDEITRLLP